ncbi:hypothetical protein FACS189475_07540 [Betaproteobacteria bacterium]|nr:hypothetical protein FACS189475_07540 [Betaproteobacteria bacterium]
MRLNGGAGKIMREEDPEQNPANVAWTRLSGLPMASGVKVANRVDEVPCGYFM